MSKKPGRTINEIVIHLVKKKKMCGAKQTAENRVRELIDKGRLFDERKGKDPNAFHRLYVNDKNSYIDLEAKIKRLSQFTNALTTIVSGGLKKLNEIEDRSFDYEYMNTIHICQLSLYSRISYVADAIDGYIKSDGDRKDLNLKLVEVMRETNKLNYAVVGDLIKCNKETEDKLKKLNIVDGNPIASLFQDLNDWFVRIFMEPVAT